MISTPVKVFLGVDVQIRRPCTYYALDQDLAYVSSGVLRGPDIDVISQHLRALASSLAEQHLGGVAVGIDAPRVGLPEPRAWFWRGGGWVPE